MRKWARKSQVLLVVAIILLGQPVNIAAPFEPESLQDQESEAPLKPAKVENTEWMRAWLQEIAVMIGYGLSHEILGTKEVRQYFILNPRWGIFLTDVMGKVPYKGALEFLVEPIAMFQFEPDNRYAFGLSALLRYNFWTGSKITPFFDAGGGVMWTDFGLPEQGSEFNFQVQGGPGLHVHLNQRTAITVQYRFHHISNAHTDVPNFGINSSLFLVGITFFLW
jgi:hypothetical protein